VSKSGLILYLAVPCVLVACGGSGSEDQPAPNAVIDGGSSDGKDASAEESSSELPKFSFFVTSLRALQDLSGSQVGFGGDLRFGETGAGAGLRGADKICAAIAERSMPGASKKGWRAFLSATSGDNGTQVDAIDRIGEGPWYDRIERLVAATKADLVQFRPRAAAAIAEDLPNEDGVPNHQPDPTVPEVDNHDTLTGSNTEGRLYDRTATCLDWTTSDGARGGRPRVGHSWQRKLGSFGGDGGFPFPFPGDGGFPFPFPGDGGFPFPFPGDGGFPFPIGDAGLSLRDYGHWISSLSEAGCGAGVNLVEMGPPNPANPTVGSGGGYGGFYCFALRP
jgi:hypothetical protein